MPRVDFKVKQTIPQHLRYTVDTFNQEFPNDDACLAQIAEDRFPNGVTKCDKCGIDRKHYRVRGRTAYACDHCGNHIYPLAGTIFEKSTTSLRLWFYAMYLMSSTRCGISAKQIQREIGVSYKTAWRMFRQIRTLMSEDLQLEGPAVEMDETYFGGVRKYGVGRPMVGDTKKTPIVGIVERKGRAVARTAPAVNGAVLLGMVREHVLPESMIYTDELKSYGGIENVQRKDGKGKANYGHRRINHSAKVYVIGDIHTNSVEGFWSLIKRGIGGVYHSVSQKYLQSYLDEYSYRYNRRDQGNLIFKSILDEVSKRAD